MLSKDVCSVVGKADEVCVNLEIEEWTEKTITVANSSCTETDQHLSITNKIANFLTNQTLTDVTFECQGKKLRAHKVILAAASPVFEAMFKEGTKELEENYVIIQDIESDVFEVFLRFLYSGNVDQLDEMFTDLFPVADKYDVQPLRKICIRHMADNISVENAVEVLALAERHSIEPSKSLALQFIKMNFADVVKPDSWASLLANHLPSDRKRMREVVTRDGGSKSVGSAPKRRKFTS
jgi:BTB/POZ domain